MTNPILKAHTSELCERIIIRIHIHEVAKSIGCADCVLGTCHLNEKVRRGVSDPPAKCDERLCQLLGHSLSYSLSKKQSSQQYQ